MAQALWDGVPEEGENGADEGEDKALEFSNCFFPE